MWPVLTRNIILVFVPFSFIFLGGIFRRNKDKQTLVKHGKNIQRLGISLLAILVAGDFLATDKASMLPFIIALSASGMLVIVFFISSYCIYKNRRK